MEFFYLVIHRVFIFLLNVIALREYNFCTGCDLLLAIGEKKVDTRTDGNMVFVPFKTNSMKYSRMQRMSSNVKPLMYLSRGVEDHIPFYLIFYL